MNVSIASAPSVRPNFEAASDLSWRSEPLAKALCADLRGEWDELTQAASDPNLFQTSAFSAYSLPLLAEMSPEAIQIRESGLLIGLVILRRDRGYAKLPLPFWRSALHHEQYLGTPLVRKGFEHAFAKGFCEWLDQAPSNCWFVNLSLINMDGALAEAFADYCRQSNRDMFAANRFERAAIRPALHSGTSAEELLRSSRRRSLRKARGKLEKLGTVKIERLSNREELDIWTSHFLAMEDTGWKHDEGSSILSCAKETALYQRIIKDAFAAKTLNFTRLCVDEQPIAYTLDIAAPPTGYCLKSAIDQKLRKYSPGVLLEFETLRHYLEQSELTLLDSCSAPDNAILNELWPDRRPVCDLVIGRSGALYRIAFSLAYAIKSAMQTAAKV